MRKTFAKLMYEEMKTNERIVILTADLGYGMWDEIRKDYPGRFFNVGSAEQLMIGMAIGLTYAGFLPVCYSITPFLLFRPFELIRTYINHEDLRIVLVGSGRDKEYAHDGISHWADDAFNVMDTLENIRIECPWDEEDLRYVFAEIFDDAERPQYRNPTGPVFLSLSKVIFPAEIQPIESNYEVCKRTNIHGYT